ncbi:quinol monooxygenase YgiN [Aequitasia blattaphilus]|uniref:Antibiotic biosynthesis monooxygenase n=1 Tax=Aequitasia blattaphilus TaxID=2949332 RepID=A0ABT1EBN2_9FIRM|nr:putative quinol monooxygenase [Aequitasia blattaphilus]MCP1103250.1 antibiotic biosynthesis monooxygenase [Aequitasia blattaphilus]MCR8615890.1 antibiotic biosynthesis monooxygenase [Aequitasia blattaphilus]
MIRVVAKFEVKPEEVTNAMPLFEELVEATRKEDGCAQYVLAKAGEEGSFVVLEGWESKDALDVHSNSEHFTRLVPQLVSLCGSAPVIDSYIQVI